MDHHIFAGWQGDVVHASRRVIIHSQTGDLFCTLSGANQGTTEDITGTQIGKDCIPAKCIITMSSLSDWEGAKALERAFSISYDTVHAKRAPAR